MSDGIELVGPFSSKVCRIVYRGFIVPNLEASEQTDGRWVLWLDGRWGTEPMAKDDVLARIPYIADAQAIGAGYACHGAAEKHNPFRVQMIGIDMVSLDGGETTQSRPHLSLVPPSTPTGSADAGK